MKFVDRARNELLKQINTKIIDIEAELKELEEKYLRDKQIVSGLKKVTEEFLSQKSEIQRQVLTNVQEKVLENIYEFLLNYPKIKKIIELLKDTPQIYADKVEEIDTDFEEFERRYKLMEILRKLNLQIEEIMAEEYLHLENTDKDETSLVSNEKKGFWQRIFGKRGKKEDINQKNEQQTFLEYKKVISEFKKYYDRFLQFDPYEGFTPSKEDVAGILFSINNVLRNQKFALEMPTKQREDDERYLADMQPIELWQEMNKYYSKTLNICTIIKNFEREIEQFEKIYNETPELFNIENIKKILVENEELKAELKQGIKQVSTKEKEFLGKKEEQYSVARKIEILRKKKGELLKKREKIEKASDLKEMGYRTKKEAAKDLEIQTKDYIIIPIPDEVKKITEMFKGEKSLKIEIDDKKFYTTYPYNIATGRINTAENLQENAVLMLPIDRLEPEYLENLRAGKIGINGMALSMKDLKIILPDNRKLDFENIQIEEIEYSEGTIRKQVKKFLGQDYTVDPDETGDYKIFNGVKNVSNNEKKAIRKAVIDSIFENIKGDVTHRDSIYVNGKLFFLTPNDEREMQLRPTEGKINDAKLFAMADKIETYLIEDNKNGVKIDELYGQLLLEYLNINKKAKADYYEEPDTNVTINEKKISIKPPLATTNKLIAKKYSRKDEDIAYKTMKLANLVNRFAHIAENEELKEELYKVKLDLIEEVIDLCKDNPNISIKKQYDKQKMANSVVMEIPGYNMIALHVVNRSLNLMSKSNKLEENENDIVATPIILNGGVNYELLLMLKNMNIKERMQFLLGLDKNTFYKLVLRMGIIPEMSSDEEKRRKIIEGITSDAKILELLQKDQYEQDDEYER